MILVLMPPRDRVQEIAYQTILPYYSPKILCEYQVLGNTIAEGINRLLQDEITHLYFSKKQWEKLDKINKSIFGALSFFKLHNTKEYDNKTWEEHLGKCGFNVSGFYKYQERCKVIKK